MKRILVVDDDKFFRKVINKLLSGHGYDIVSASGGEEALEILQMQTFDLMISDINMLPMNGMELLEKSRAAYPEMGVIMLTGHDEIEVALDAMKKGAFDFLVKPLQVNDLYSTVQRSLKCYSAAPQSKPAQSRTDMLEGLVSESATMGKVCEMIKRIAPAKVAVLLYGERGTDKELIARTIHHYSPRKDAPMISLDCITLLPEQMEPELFGQVRGKDTAARAGLFEAARGGTLFLDNIDAMPLDMQTKLLEVMMTNRNRRVGGSDPVPIDVRLIVASSENLAALAQQWLFNENLYYRLSTLQIDIPPLRDRTEDIPFLIDKILRRCLGPNAAIPALDSTTKKIFYNYTWPGNTRELEAAIRHVLAAEQDGVITKEMIPAGIVDAFEEGGHNSSARVDLEQLKGHFFKALLRKKRENLLGGVPDLPDGG